MPVTLDVVGKTMAPLTFEYTDRDVILYALGVGAGTDELQYVYEQGLKVIPTFGVVPAFPALMGLNTLMTFNPIMLLHGEQRIEVRKPFPTRGKVTTTGSIKNIWDKGSGAVVMIDAETVDEKGDVLCVNTFGAFLRGEGGFGGERGPSGPPQRPAGASAGRGGGDGDASPAGGHLSPFRRSQPAAHRSQLR